MTTNVDSVETNIHPITEKLQHTDRTDRDRAVILKLLVGHNFIRLVREIVECSKVQPLNCQVAVSS